MNTCKNKKKNIPNYEQSSKCMKENCFFIHRNKKIKSSMYT
jgi:hypothetical protein